MRKVTAEALRRAAGQAVIGPNAVIRMAEALEALEGGAVRESVFERAGLAHYIEAPPEDMVPEEEVTRLMAAVASSLPATRAQTAGWIAGQRTAAYLLAHRIPMAAQVVLRALPARLASRALIASISRHAWTFAGSGAVSFAPGHPVVIEMRSSPLCRGRRAQQPCCHFYAATFETLYRALVATDARAVERTCRGMGDAVCRFEIDWQRHSRDTNEARSPRPPSRSAASAMPTRGDGSM